MVHENYQKIKSIKLVGMTDFFFWQISF